MFDKWVVRGIYWGQPMNYAVVATKVDPQMKKRAQEKARELGIPLSAVVKASLKDFIETQRVVLSTRGEEPSEYLIKSIEQARKNRKAGKGSPIFDNAKDALKYLDEQGI